MYNISCSVVGTAPLLHHAFGATQLKTLQENTKKRTGTPDYSLEWLDTMYARDGYLYQPASHLEGAMTKAGGMFKIRGQRAKTYKDLIRAFVYVCPDEIPHIRGGQAVLAPDESLLVEPTQYLSVSIMRVVVQRAAVARSRLQIATGWQLDFTLQVIDDQLAPDALKAILEHAGSSVGIGDFRPRYGRFEVTAFNVQ